MIVSNYYCKSKHWPPRINKLKKIFNNTIVNKDLKFKKNQNYFLNFVLTNDKEIIKLNKKYKNKKKETDVLTFVSKSSNKYLKRNTYCDIFFSAETIKKDSKRNLINFYDHLTHLIIHCFLHVNGYDHKTNIDFLKMKNLEKKILSKLEIKNPYAI